MIILVDSFSGFNSKKRGDCFNSPLYESILKFLKSQRQAEIKDEARPSKLGSSGPRFFQPASPHKAPVESTHSSSITPFKTTPKC